MKAKTFLALFVGGILVSSVLAGSPLPAPNKIYPSNGLTDVGDVTQKKAGGPVTVEFQWESMGDYAYGLRVQPGDIERSTNDTKYKLELDPQITYSWSVKACHTSGWWPFSSNDCDDQQFGEFWVFTTGGIAPLKITTERRLPDGIVGLDYGDFKLEAEGGTIPREWGGTFNELLLGYGLELSKTTGIISGTPLKSVGQMAPVINVKDSKKGFDGGQFYIKIKDADLKITTEILPPGVEGGEYSPFELQVVGGSPPYIKWELIGGGLGGLKLKDGIIKGTPSEAGDFLFDVSVTDSKESTAVKKDILLYIYKSDDPNAPPSGTTGGTTDGQPSGGQPSGGQPSRGQGLGITIPNPLGENTTFETLLNAIINFIFALGLAVAPIILIIAGFMFVTSAGDSQRLETAKKMILYSLIGLAVLLLARGLVAVLKSIIGVK